MAQGQLASLSARQVRVLSALMRVLDVPVGECPLECPRCVFFLVPVVRFLFSTAHVLYNIIILYRQFQVIRVGEIGLSSCSLSLSLISCMDSLLFYWFSEGYSPRWAATMFTCRWNPCSLIKIYQIVTLIVYQTRIHLQYSISRKKRADMSHERTMNDQTKNNR